jgi:cation diffusion facilitator CzcD-associated flavoprotein CzcO
VGPAPDPLNPELDYDVVVVGAGLGGIHAVHRFSQAGCLVAGLEGAPGVGGVWYHNRYPGARVDVESLNYCFFDPDLFRDWRWNERYASQPEILAYLEFVAARYDVHRLYSFSTWVVSAQWDPDSDCYVIRTDTGRTLRARFLVMTTGQLSEARDPAFPGLEEFQGRWVQTSHWPEEDVPVEDRRIAVIGTGSSGVQVSTALADVAGHLYVFQRTPNYSVPARNGPFDEERFQDYCGRVEDVQRTLLGRANGTDMPTAEVSAYDLTPEQRLSLLEERWAHGGHTMNLVFTDQNTDIAVNEIVAEFVRDKVRETVDDPETAERLVPDRYPMGSRRLIVDTGYYEIFNRDNVTLVDLGREPLVRFTSSGIQTQDAHYDIDLAVFALGFDAFTGALDKAHIRNEHGEQPSDRWKRGPRTYLGLMTAGFPNLFIVTGPGSPSVLANMVLDNVQHTDFICGLLWHMTRQGLTRVEPTLEAEDEWTAHVAEVAEPFIRLTVQNYMVHVNQDGSRVFIPYIGGLSRYVETCERVAAAGYTGFAFGSGSGPRLVAARKGTDAQAAKRSDGLEV